MKLITILLVLLLNIFCIIGQEYAFIKGRINSEKGVNLVIYKPFNGYFNSVFYKPETSSLILKKDSNQIAFQDTVHLDHPCFVRLFLTTPEGNYITKCDLLLFPNDTVDVSFNVNDEKIDYIGSNAEGHQLFHNITNEPSHVYLPLSKILDKFPENKSTFIKEVSDYGNAMSFPFEKLLQKGAITRDYYRLIQYNFQIAIFASVENSLLFGEKKGVTISRKTIDCIIDSIFQLYPSNDIRLRSLWNTYWYNCDFHVYQTYKKLHLSYANALSISDSTITKSGKQYKIKKECVKYLYIEDPEIRQEEWGYYLLFLIPCRPGYITEDIIEQYEQLNPQNRWSSFLKRQLINYPVPKNGVLKLSSPSGVSQLSSPIIDIGDSVSVNTFNDLIKQLPKSKFYFVDVWASWCHPCVSAFSSNQYFDQFLINNHIPKVYISLDTNKEDWKSAVKNYSLGGYNVLANESLIAKIKEKLDLNISDPLLIPRYLLINDNGELISKELQSPMQYEKLEKQIKDIVQNIH